MLPSSTTFNVESNVKVIPYEERRKYFRVDFIQLLEADMTILEINGKRTHVGSTKVVVKDMGPGGLRFVSNIRLPIKRDLVLQFTTELLGKEIKVYGCPVWMEVVLEQLYEYGVEFTFDENDRMYLTGVLNQVQVKMRNNSKFVHGRFVSNPLIGYFKQVSDLGYQ